MKLFHRQSCLHLQQTSIACWTWKLIQTSFKAAKASQSPWGTQGNNSVVTYTLSSDHADSPWLDKILSIHTSTARTLAESLVCSKTKYTEVWISSVVKDGFLSPITVNHNAFVSILSILKSRSNYYVFIFSFSDI